MLYKPETTSLCDFGSRHPPPVKQYTSLKEEKGIEDEEDGKIWVNKVVKDTVPDAGGTEGTQGNR